jgi:hypothetical protein
MSIKKNIIDHNVCCSKKRKEERKKRLGDATGPQFMLIGGNKPDK